MLENYEVMPFFIPADVIEIKLEKSVENKCKLSYDTSSKLIPCFGRFSLIFSSNLKSQPNINQIKRFLDENLSTR